MRAHSPGGRFTSDFELNSVGDGITYDLTNPAGTTADWWRYDQAALTRDPIYDVEPVGVGRVWTGPFKLAVVRASITQGTNQSNQRGFYNTDTLHLTINVDDLKESSPELFTERGFVKPTISDANKYRAIWKGQVYRPIRTQQAGQLANRHTIITVDMVQLMPDELVNDTQFLSYAQGV